MNSRVPYNKQTLDTPNPIARFSHQARYRFSLIKVLEYLRFNGELLDFGCGDGSFLHKLSLASPQAVLYGFDPESDQIYRSYQKINALDDLKDRSMDIVCCFETLEHLYDHERERFLVDMKRILKTNGKVVVSVPIIGGPTLLLKDLNRNILFKRISEYSLKELLLASLLFIPAPKPENPRITHKGFNFREIEAELSTKFKLIEKMYSPFPLLPWFLNSQLFLVLSV
jgi:2-polyprenyl-3-methyl-5-hydroxy-6-metoxy-1,4-benzoquinol methylase